MNELEIFIVAKTKESSNTTYMEKIFPIEKENIGIRAEILIHSEDMKLGFQAIERHIQTLEKTMEGRFELLEKHIQALERTMDKRFEAVEKQIQTVEKQIQSNEKHIQTLERTMDKRFEAVEKQIQTVEKQIQSVDKRVDFQSKLLWLIIAILVTSVGSFIGYVLKII